MSIGRSQARERAYAQGAETRRALLSSSSSSGPCAAAGCRLRWQLWSQTGKRTASARCLTDVRVLAITYEQYEQLYYQNPKFGLQLVRLIVERFEANHPERELESS